MEEDVGCIIEDVVPFSVLLGADFLLVILLTYPNPQNLGFLLYLQNTTSISE